MKLFVKNNLLNFNNLIKKIQKRLLFLPKNCIFLKEWDIYKCRANEKPSNKK